ncbi:9115_t:CDS:1, partial [Racocetra persica]
GVSRRLGRYKYVVVFGAEATEIIRPYLKKKKKVHRKHLIFISQPISSVSPVQKLVVLPRSIVVFR